MSKFNGEFKFEGKSTDGNWKRTCYARDLIELYNELVKNEVINTEEEDPLTTSILRKNGMAYTNFLDEDGDIDYLGIDLYLNDAEQLTDEEMITLIHSQNGNAYYQTLFQWCISMQNYVDIEQYFTIEEAWNEFMAKRKRQGIKVNTLVFDIVFFDDCMNEDETQFVVENLDGAAEELSKLFSDFCKENGFCEKLVIEIKEGCEE